MGEALLSARHESAAREARLPLERKSRKHTTTWARDTTAHN